MGQVKIPSGWSSIRHCHFKLIFPTLYPGCQTTQSQALPGNILFPAQRTGDFWHVLLQKKTRKWGCLSSLWLVHLFSIWRDISVCNLCSAEISCVKKNTSGMLKVCAKIPQISTHATHNIKHATHNIEVFGNKTFYSFQFQHLLRWHPDTDIVMNKKEQCTQVLLLILVLVLLLILVLVLVLVHWGILLGGRWI